MKVIEESEKCGWKLNLQKKKIMASGPITSWQINGETMETVGDYFLGLQNQGRWWLQPWSLKTLASWKKTMTNLDSILKVRNTALPTKICIVKSMVFPVVMYGCESWTIKKAECQRIDAFELSCWRRLLRVPWTARRSNESILKEISPEYSLDWYWSGSSNTLATWCEELTHWKRPWCWERLQAGEGVTDDEMVGWHHWLNEHEFEQAPGVGDG